METTTISTTRTLRITDPWQRPEQPRPIRWQARDSKICEEVWKHRYLSLEHLHALFAHGPARRDSNLARRCRLLWENEFLERPKAARHTRVLSGLMIYALGKKGAKLLDDESAKRGENPPLELARTDWTRERSWGPIDHELEVATVLTAVRLAGRTLNQTMPDFNVDWVPYPKRDTIRLTTPKKETIDPDGYFSFTVSIDGRPETRHHFLELDRNPKKSEKNMRVRYGRYLEWWKANRDRGYKHVRVLTVTETPQRMESLRRIAYNVGRGPLHPHTWKGLLFSHLGAFALEKPERIFTPIFKYPDLEEPVALL